MPRWTLLTPEDARPQPWKNGRGETLELAIWPPSSSLAAGDFDWRISRARVAEDGPFSRFAGFVRALIVTDGPGLLLDHGEAGGRALLRPLDVHAFDGAWGTRCELLGAPARDLGVIARSGSFGVEVEALRLGQRRVQCDLGPAEHGFLHVLRGVVETRLEGEDDALQLTAEHSLHVCADARGADLEARGASSDALALFVRLTPTDPAQAARTRADA